MRPIDADKFNNFDYDSDRGNEFDSPREAYIQGIEYVLNGIDMAPTLDAVAVVRCKDCKHNKENENYRFCEVTQRMLDRYGFCNYGVRMEDKA